MGYTHVGSAWGFNNDNGTSLSVSAALSWNEDDLIVGIACWEDGASSPLATIDCTDGTFALAMLTTANGPSNENYMRIGWLQAGSAGSNKTFRMNTGSVPYRHILVMILRPDSGDTISLAGGTPGPAWGSGGGGSKASGDISPNGSDMVALGVLKTYNYNGLANLAIEGTAATASQAGEGGMSAIWWVAYTSNQANLTATATQGSSTWLCGIVAFEAAAGGELSNVTEVLITFTD